MQKVSEYPSKRVLFVANAYFNQIKNLPEEARNKKLFDTLTGTAQSYGARKEVPGFVMTECCRLVLTKFSFLSLQEITEAYRQKAAGEFKVKGGEMYNGIFNAENLGKVLTAYNEERKRIMAKFLSVAIEEKEALQKKGIKLVRAILFEICFEQIMRASGYKGWRDVPEWWYEAAKKRALFSYEPGEKAEYYKRAQEILPEERALQAEQEGISLSALLRKTQPKDDQALLASIARKLVIFEKFIL